ncbi:MAG: L-threonylcarbamoyladenylate synthase [Spirochaetota bacterium]|nr:L-threonylcarbamoyladenylate synthase [Spirochaetota bacterium]
MICYLDEDNKRKIINLLCDTFKQGKLAIIPTDTVYGISGDYFSFGARERIIEIKQRPLDKSFIILVKNKESLFSFADQDIPKLILDELPTSLTLIVKNKHYNLYGEKTIAIRLSDDPWLSELFNRLDIPIISTSANISGDNIPEILDEIISIFRDKVDLIVLSREKKKKKPPSTILDISSKPYRIIRQGDYLVPNELLN